MFSLPFWHGAFKKIEISPHLPARRGQECALVTGAWTREMEMCTVHAFYHSVRPLNNSDLSLSRKFSFPFCLDCFFWPHLRFYYLLFDIEILMQAEDALDFVQTLSLTSLNTPTKENGLDSLQSPVEINQNVCWILSLWIWLWFIPKKLCNT